MIKFRCHGTTVLSAVPMHLVLALLLAFLPLVAQELVAQEGDAEPYQRTEEREACASRDEMRQPFFGATHLHTGMSFDAAIRFVPPRPDDAYRFAKGEGPILGADPTGRPTRIYKIDRPLDWGVVTDHSEHFGEMGICVDDHDDKTPPPKGYFSLECQLIRGFYWQPGVHLPPSLQRNDAKGAFSMLVLPNNGPSSRNSRLPLCESGEADCDAAELDVWQEMQNAAERAYDRSSACKFTSFIGYEATATPSGTNWHRNVIFRNHQVIDRPITAIDMAQAANPDPNVVPPLWLGGPYVARLWEGLQKQCLDQDNGCDVLTIPHNSNLGGGIALPGGKELVPPMFFDPQTPAEAKMRAKFEPLVEIYQNKGSSECRWDPRFNSGVETTDELCDFELLDSGSILAASGVGTGSASVGTPPSAFNERSYVRNVLKDGLAYQQEHGVNPFKLGVVASSDSHNGTMGWHPENADFGGHLGIEDAIPVRAASTIQNSSGGHSVVWAEENSRDAIFSALKRKETYGTSGTRPVVRFFGGFDLPADACERNLVEIGYQKGVPMGGDLGAGSGIKTPRFIAAAWMDEFIGTPLQRVQLVKGWVDAKGATHEAVYDVAGGANGASVNTETCEPVGEGYQQLCAVFEDPDFDPAELAFYYLRVLENPVCRYSTHICRQDYGINPLSTDCSNQLAALQASDPVNAANAAMCCSNETTSPYLQPVIQERAWTSPIWYTPGS